MNPLRPIAALRRTSTVLTAYALGVRPAVASLLLAAAACGTAPEPVPARTAADSAHAPPRSFPPLPIDTVGTPGIDAIRVSQEPGPVDDEAEEWTDREALTEPDSTPPSPRVTPPRPPRLQ